MLEYATPRAGDYVPVEGREIGLGVVNPRSDDIEEPAAIVRRVERLLPHVDAGRIFLNPDCGFGTFASRPMNVATVAERKLAAMVAAADALRENHGGTTPRPRGSDR